MKSLLYFLATITIILADDSLETFTVGNKLFTQDVYNQILLDNEENILVSPFSAETVLALTQSGAVGDTGAEIRTTLHLPDTKQETEGEFKSVLPTIHSDFISLVTANKIYVENSYPIKDGFKRVATDVYQADFQNVEFKQTEAAADEINKWVEDHTGGKIKELVTSDDIDVDTKVVLVNALFFQGNWTVPFDPANTKSAKFYTSTSGSDVDIPLMFQQGVAYNYYESTELEAQILEIPFEGEEATMTIVLPNEKEGIALLEKQIGNVLVTPPYKEEVVQILLPKFKIESTLDFKKILRQMGVQKAFSPGEADFSDMAGAKGELYITSAKQKTFIDVSEIGVAAAAATEISTGREGPEPTKYFVADHPFVFYIKINDVVLFQGRVLLPEY